MLFRITWFLGYIYVYYLFNSCLLAVVHGGHDPIKSAGLNRSCGAILRISALTRPLERGDSLFYDEPSNSLIFLDASQSSVYRYFIDSRRYYNITLGPKQVNLVVPVEGLLDTYLVSYGNDVAILKWNCQSGKFSFRTLGRQDPSRPYPQNFMNEGKVGRTKSKPFFFYSTPVPNPALDFEAVPSKRSVLYDFANGKKKVQLSGLGYPKGFGFSYDGRTIFFSDSLRNQTYRACYDEKTNRIENVKLLLNYSDLCIPGRPDSMAIDSQGYLWLCNLENRLLKLNPYNGNVECSIKLPTASTSSLVFGKCPNSKSNVLNCIYVATWSFGAPRSKWNGALLMIEGVESTGILDYKIPLSTIYGSFKKRYRGNGEPSFQYQMGRSTSCS